MSENKFDYWWLSGIFVEPAPRPTGFVSSDADEFDVIVVGTGMSGFASAIHAHDHGRSVLVLEAADEVGGTTYKSGAGMWVPNNHKMRALGIHDDRDACLDFMAKVSYPGDYDPQAPRLGMSEWQWDLMNEYYDNASDAIEALRDAGALNVTFFRSFTDEYPAMVSYNSHLDNSIQGYYRHLMPQRPDGVEAVGWEMIRQLGEAVKARGIDVRTGHRVQGVIQSPAGEVVGVRATTADGEQALYARQGVVFGTGGFPHNLDIIERHWRGPLYSSCAVPTAQGDFVTIGEEIGAELGNMKSGWFYEDLLEKAAPHRVCMEGGINVPPGDAMIYVDATGKRILNEKSIYQERAQHFFEPGENGDYPNRALFMIYDTQLTTDTRPWLFLDTFIAPKQWIIEGATLEELAANIQERLNGLTSVIGEMHLAADFAEQLAATVERFNGFARSGTDEDFHRGETVHEHDWNGPAREGNDKNRTMYPFTQSGPYFCTITCGMVLDTNGGPKTNGRAQVLRADGSVIPGLYGAGNCIANVSGEGYLSGGSTLGPAATFAYLAAKNVAQEPVRDLASVRGAATA
ncbi:unannotated protein [freshwater metagenome]|uniref:Unannotated protein n=1 Tax=freshwater metagenome TaxID=449393 RepID=A0A6J7HSJ1_9ZZZZ|nr:FAD-dependent oxidoreductase [Actinomycetota bacterium]